MVTFLLVAAALCYLFFALLTYQGRKKSLDNRLFSAICILFALWSLGIVWFIWASSSQQILWSAKLFYVAATWFGPLLTLFTVHYPKERKIPFLLTVFSISSAIFVSLAIVLVDNFLLNTPNWTGERKNVAVNQHGYIIFAVHFIIFYLLAVGISIYKFIAYKDQDRSRASVYIAGIITTSVPGFVVDLILPFRGDYSLIWIGPVASIAFLGATGYSIVRHRMFEIKLFMLRAITYTITSLVLAGLYIAPVMIGFAKIFDVPLQPVRFIAATLIGLFVAMNYYKLQSWFNKNTSRIFFREAYDPTALMSELNAALVTTIDIQKLLNSSSGIIERHLKPEFCRFLLCGIDGRARIIESAPGTISAKNAEEWLGIIGQGMKQDVGSVELLGNASRAGRFFAQKNISVVLRLSTDSAKQDNTLGYLILGARKSGKTYDAVDMQVLKVVSDVLVIAMQNALHYEEIQKFNVTLQGRVEDATRKLRTTNDKLKKLDETKDEFISMASHQLRTPLTSIKGYLSMVLEGDAGKLNSQQEEMLKQSYMSSQRMVNLIADLLNLSRLNTGKFVIDPSPTDLRMIVDQEVGQLRETAKAKGLTLNWVAPKMFTVLPLDDGKIHQVVMNFIDNAIYYTPPGGSIDVTLVETPTAVEFRVKDNGIGVPRSVQHHLFTKFYRAENARQARPDGTGLGIFMAKKVIAAQGGSILFESKEGKGSTFGFRFNKEALKTRMAAQNPDTLGSPASKPVSI